MDSHRFDTLTRILSASGSRRGALAAGIGRSLGGALGVLSLAAPEDVWAESGKCKPTCGTCQRCKKGDCDKRHGKKRCKRGKCKPEADGLACAGGTCQGGICVCASGLTACGGICVNLQTDETQCGVCGSACTASQVCQAGQCFPRGICAGTPLNCTTFDTCGPSCRCATSVEGNPVCVVGQAICPMPLTPPCQTSAECSGGTACIDISGCCMPSHPPGTKACFSPCPNPA